MAARSRREFPSFFLEFFVCSFFICLYLVFVLSLRPSHNHVLSLSKVLQKVYQLIYGADGWGLGRYKRNTTPQLKARNVISFKKTISCETSTDVSLYVQPGRKRKLRSRSYPARKKSSADSQKSGFKCILDR